MLFSEPHVPLLHRRLSQGETSADGGALKKRSVEDVNPGKSDLKISSSYSGRVLKQVFEDGQELESPKEEYLTVSSKSPLNQCMVFTDLGGPEAPTVLSPS